VHYAPAFLASMEERGTPWLARLATLREQRGEPLDFALQTQRILPAIDGIPRIELTYRVRCKRGRSIEQITVRPPLLPEERLQIVDHTLPTS